VEESERERARARKWSGDEEGGGGVVF
jgi:hypothetical protein